MKREVDKLPGEGVYLIAVRGVDRGDERERGEREKERETQRNIGRGRMTEIEAEKDWEGRE